MAPSIKRFIQSKLFPRKFEYEPIVEETPQPNITNNHKIDQSISEQSYQFVPFSMEVSPENHMETSSASFVGQLNHTDDRTLRSLHYYRRLFICLVIIIGFVLVLSLLKERTQFNSSSPIFQTSSFYPIISYDNESSIYSLHDSNSDDVIVSGKYDINVNGNGWNYLEINVVDIPPFPSKSSDPKVISARSDKLIGKYLDSMTALGYLEGYITCNDINSWYLNFYSGLFDGGDPRDELIDFLRSNFDWMKTMANKNWKYSEHWLAVHALVHQLEGLVAGQQRGCPGSDNLSSQTTFLPSMKKRPNILHFLLMNSNGDIYQIGQKFNQQDAPPSVIIPDDMIDTVNGGNSQSKTSTNPSSLKQFLDRQLKQSHFDINEYLNEFRILDNSKPDIESIQKILFSRNVLSLKGQRPLEYQSKASTMDAQDTIEIEDPEEGVWIAAEPYSKDHCSALVKLLPDRSDVVFGHNTWDDYQLMAPRIFKHITHPLISSTRIGNIIVYNILGDSNPKKTNIKSNPDSISSTTYQKSYTKLGPEDVNHVDDDYIEPNSEDHNWTPIRHEVYFSSCPGLVVSVDDFYSVKGRGNLAVMETSLDIYNSDLLSLIHPESLLSWARSRVANMLAKDGESWAQYFSAYHSGTYANQWMVLNLDSFTPGEDPYHGFLTVLEEVPGYIHYDDLTSHVTLADYWASYNNPFFDDIFILSGYLDLCMNDPSSCHYTDPRALIFHQLKDTIIDIDTLKLVLTYNRYQSDQISSNDSCLAISCRQDLEPEQTMRYPFGAVDAKVSSVESARIGIKRKNDGKPIIHAHMGPTTADQSPFCWSQFNLARNKRGKKFSHVGHPTCFDYQWETMPPMTNGY